jgi:prepilin-type N-terminal cleavage/methylation domain-containing protein
MNKGFTLIELLVVVLIIGILAAIALPQYTKAVERSRMSEAVQMLGDLATAQSIYYMQHNNFAASREVLNSFGDVQVPAPGNTWALSFGNAGTMTMTRQGGMFSGGQLTMAVGTDGAITKSCTNPSTGSNKAEFCTMGNTAGYTKGS